MEVLPCSRVAHIARMKKPYHSNIAFHTRRNALRVAEVWMDEYKSNVYLAWNIPMEVREFLERNVLDYHFNYSCGKNASVKQRLPIMTPCALAEPWY